MKKNCYNCKYLDYYQADYKEFSESGYSCNGRNYDRRGSSSNAEYRHLTQLNNPEYLRKSKRCCKLNGDEK